MLQKFSDLQILSTLDTTHEGTTQLIIGKFNDKLLVCKSIQKKSFKDSKSIEHINNQKQALKYFTQKQTKGINRLVNTFQDEDKLYIVLQPVKGLPLHKLIQMVGNFNSQFTRIIAVQVGLILREFHNSGYLYRDIKASNFMMDQKGKITLIDLGHAKKIDKNRTYTICGTVHSMPPQIYQNCGYSYEFDYYGFGILIYQLLTGRAPFGYGNSNPNIVAEMKNGVNQEMMQKIKCQVTRDLIVRLLSEPTIRLGCKNGFDEILEHQYFNCPDFFIAKDIYDGIEEIDSTDPNFQLYIEQIMDFGLQDYKFEQILPTDPFYKFFG